MGRRTQVIRGLARRGTGPLESTSEQFTHLPTRNLAWWCTCQVPVSKPRPRQRAALRHEIGHRTLQASCWLSLVDRRVLLDTWRRLKLLHDQLGKVNGDLFSNSICIFYSVLVIMLLRGIHGPCSGTHGLAQTRERSSVK